MTVQGRVTRVNGPVVHLEELGNVVSFEFVEVGPMRLPGEIISLSTDHVVAQLYEYTGGLSVGDPAWAAGHPLTVDLGPGLLGGIYDGLLRPLDSAADFLGPRTMAGLDESEHTFAPHVVVGEQVTPGASIGSVATPSGLEHLVLVPSGVSGTIDSVAEPGSYGSSATVASIDGIEIRLTTSSPIRHARPVAERLVDRPPFNTGQRVLDTMEPIAKGSSATVIGGFGEGKTMLLEQVAKWGDADVIVYVGCGERGNELADLIDELRSLTDPRTGRSLRERTIILANTSNMPVMAREASIYTATTIAEYYRDMGLHAVIIADSTSRWAEARRELASRTGAMPAEQGYPADLASSLAAFYQRAGLVTTLGGRVGAVTIVTSVSPPGGDATEPVAASTQRFVQAVWGLDRALAYARHYPAVSWQSSFSRDVDRVARWHAVNGDADWALRRSRLQSILTEAVRLQGLADLVGKTALAPNDRVVLLTARLIREAFLQQSALSANDASCSSAKQAELGRAVLGVHDAALAAVDAGTPASVIEGFDLGPLVRAKDQVGPDDASGVAAIAGQLLADLEKAVA